MKKYISLFFVAVTITLHSQDFEPAQLTFHPNESATFTNIYLSADSVQFQQRNFMLGVHWGPMNRRHSEAQLIRQKDEWFLEWGVDTSKFVDSCDTFVKPYGTSHAGGPEVLNGRGIHYDPTLPLNPNKPDSLVIRPGDNSGQVFGFAVRKGWIPNNPSHPDFNRLILDDTLNGDIVLAEPWPSNQLNNFAITII
jgi:hypothetical protein